MNTLISNIFKELPIVASLRKIIAYVLIFSLLWQNSLWAISILAEELEAPRTIICAHGQVEVLEPGSIKNNVVHNIFEDLQISKGGKVIFKRDSNARTIYNRIYNKSPIHLSGTIEADTFVPMVFANHGGITLDNPDFKDTSDLALIAGSLAQTNKGMAYGIDQGILTLKQTFFENKNDLKFLSLAGREILIHQSLLSPSESIVLTAGKHIKGLEKEKEWFSKTFEQSEPQLPYKDAIHVDESTIIRSKGIFLQSLEKGDSVHVKGLLETTDADIIIRARGDIYLDKIIAHRNLNIKTTGKVFFRNQALVGGNVKIKAENITVNKGLSSIGSLYLKASNHLTIKGNIDSKDKINLVGQNSIGLGSKITSQGSFTAASKGNIFQEGAIFSEGSLRIKGQSFIKSGNLISQSSLKISTTEDMDNQRGDIISSSWSKFSSKTGNIINNGRILGEGAITINANYTQNYGLLHTKDILKTNRDFFNEENGSVEAKSLFLPLAVLSRNLGRIGLQDGIKLESRAATLKGVIKTQGRFVVGGKELTIEGQVSAQKGLFFDNLEKLTNKGVLSAFGDGFQGRLIALYNDGKIDFSNVNAWIGKSVNQKSGIIRTGRHFSLQGDHYYNKGKVFTCGVHQVVLTGSYEDTGLFYCPTLFLLNAKDINYLPYHKSFFKDAILRASSKLTAGEKVSFVLQGNQNPCFLQLSSKGDLSYNGEIRQFSANRFPLLDYFSIFGETPVPYQDFIKDISTLPLGSWKEMKRSLGSGITLQAGRNINCQKAVVDPESGSLNLIANGQFYTDGAKLKAGYFKGNNAAIQSKTAILNDTQLLSLFGNSSIFAHDSATFTGSYIRGGQLASIHSNSIWMETSAVKSEYGAINIQGDEDFSSNNSTYQSKVFDLKTKNARMHNNSLMNQNVSCKANTMNSTGDTHDFTHMFVESKEFSSKGSTYRGKTLGVKTTNTQLEGSLFTTESSAFQTDGQHSSIGDTYDSTHISVESKEFSSKGSTYRGKTLGVKTTNTQLEGNLFTTESSAFQTDGQHSSIGDTYDSPHISVESKEFSSKGSTYRGKTLGVKTTNTQLEGNLFTTESSAFQTDRQHSSIGDTYDFTHMSVESKEFSSKGSTYRGKTLGVKTTNTQLEGNLFTNESSAFQSDEQHSSIGDTYDSTYMSVESKEFSSKGSTYRGKTLGVKTTNTQLEGNLFTNKSSAFQSDGQHSSIGDTYDFTHMFVESKEFSSKGSTYRGKTLGVKTTNTHLQNNSFMNQYASFKANTMNASGNYHEGQSHTFDIIFFSGGVQSAVNMADGLTNVSQVSLKMATQDYENTGSKTFEHSNISLSFGSITNTGNIKANGKLKLHGERSFTNTSSISAKDDLFTTTKGIHRNDGTLDSEQGINYVEGDKIISRAHEETVYKYGWLSQATGVGVSKKIVRPQYKGRHVIQKAHQGIDHVGVNIQAKENISLVSEYGDIHLDPYTHHIQTKYDQLKKYESAHITAGGNVNVHAERGGMRGHTLQATAGGSMGFKAQKAIDFRSIAEIYTSERESGSGFLGFNSWHREKQSADFNQTNLETGQTLSVKSTQEGINLQGANFVSETKDIALEAQGNIDLSALKVTLHSRDDTSSWWGLTGIKKSGYHQEARVFGAQSHDHIGARSYRGKVIGEGAQFKAKSVSIHGEKGIELNELVLEQAESVKNYGLDLTIFGFNIFKPKQFKGPNASIGIGYSQDAQQMKMKGAIHGDIQTDHLTLGTGKGKGVGANLEGTNIGGLIQEDTDLALRTQNVKFGGSEQSVEQTASGFNAKVGVNVLTLTPEVEGGGSKTTKTKQTHQQAKLSLGNVNVEEEDTEIHISGGADGHIKSSTGKEAHLTVDHAQSKETQSGGGGGAKIGVDKLYVNANAQWGEKVSSEGLTNFTLGQNTQNLTRTDIHHGDYDTRGGAGLFIGISEEGVNFGVQTQIGDKSFGFSSQSFQDISSFAEGLGDLSNLQFPMNLHEVFDTAQSILNRVDTAASLLQSMGVNVPENVQKFVNTAKTAVDITKFVDSQLSNGILQKAYDEFKIPESFNEFLSQGNGVVAKLTDFVSQAKTMGIPISDAFDNVLHQTRDILKGTEMLTHMVEDAALHGPQNLKETDFKASFADLTTYGNQLLTNLSGVQTLLQATSFSLPEELQNFLQTGKAVLNTTENLYQGLYEGAFIKTLGESALPQLIEEIVGQTQTLLDGLNTGLALEHKLPSTFRTFLEGVDYVKEGIKKFNETQTLSDKLNILSSHEGLQQGLSMAPQLQKAIVEELPALKDILSPQVFSSLEETLKSTSYLIAQTAALQDRLREVQFAKDMIFGDGNMMNALFQEGLDLEDTFKDSSELMKGFGIISQDAMVDFIAKGRGTLNALQTYKNSSLLPETPLEALAVLSKNLPIWKALGVNMPQSLESFLQSQKEVYQVIKPYQNMMQICPSFMGIEYPNGWEEWAQTLTESLLTLQGTVELFETFNLNPPKEASAFITEMARILKVARQTAPLKDNFAERDFINAALSSILLTSYDD